MKLKRIFALALCSALSVGLVTLSASADNSTDAIKTHKKVSGPDDDGNYTITLEAWAEGKVTVTENAVPTDFVLVLDRSASMSDPVNDQTTQTREEALKYALTQFVNLVEEKADGTGDEVDYRIALVGFSWEGNNGNGVYLGKSFKTNPDDSDLSSALKSIQDKSTILESVNAYSALEMGGTDPAIGLRYAQTIFSKSSDDRNRVVVLFTDGTPGLTAGGPLTGPTCMYNAVNEANTLKNTYNAKIFTVGLIEGLDISDLPKEKFHPGDDTMDKYMHCVSSNYPNATTTTSIIGNITVHYIVPNGGKNSGYYIGATDADELARAFETTVNSSGGTNTTLNSSAVVKDVLTDAFTFSGDVAGAVTIYTADCTGASEGKLTFGTLTQVTDDSITAKIDGQTVSVTGFDFAGNWAGDHGNGEYSGKKLIMKLKVKPIDGFLGGDVVTTNVADISGVYKNKDADTPLKKFGETSPTTAVPVKTITPSVQDQTIYLSREANLTDLIKGLDSRIDGKNNQYVDITYTIRQDGDEIGKYTIEAGKETGSWSGIITATPITCTEYTVTCTVTASDSNTTSEAQTATVHVLEPQVKVDDQTIYLSETPDKNTGSVTGWKCGCDTETATVSAVDPDVTWDLVKNGTFNSVLSTKLTECAKVQAVATLAERTFTSANTATVHVATPTITYQNSTIYYGNEANYSKNLTSTEWADSCNDDKTVTGKAPAITLTYDKDAAAFDECTDVKVTAAKIGDTNYLGNITIVYPSTDHFTVHVAKPTFTTDNVTIYRGNDTDLEERVTVANEWTCDGHGTINKTYETKSDGTKPTITYTFNDGANVTDAEHYSPVDCKNLTVTATVGNKTWTGNINNFTVHVLQPVFTVTTQDVWADYGTSVDLAANCISSTLHWEDQTTDHTTPATLPAGAPSVATSGLTYTFTPADKLKTDGKTYEVGEADQPFTVTGLIYTLSNDLTKTVSTSTENQQTLKFADKADFTVYVNKFKLTITRNWKDGDPTCYRQDAIFTVKQGTDTNAPTFKVVIPKEQPSVTISGLICGKDYTVTADSNWSWRWTADGAKTVSHGHNGAISTAPQTGCDQTVEIKNTLNQQKTLWLSGDWWCQNTCIGTKIEKDERKKSN